MTRETRHFCAFGDANGNSPMRFPELVITTPSRFARHPSTGGEFSVPSFDIIANPRNQKSSK
jgi:hypothetical protein